MENKTENKTESYVKISFERETGKSTTDIKNVSVLEISFAISQLLITMEKNTGMSQKEIAEQIIKTNKSMEDEDQQQE